MSLKRKRQTICLPIIKRRFISGVLLLVGGWFDVYAYTLLLFRKNSINSHKFDPSFSNNWSDVANPFARFIAKSILGR